MERGMKDERTRRIRGRDGAKKRRLLAYLMR